MIDSEACMADNPRSYNNQQTRTPISDSNNNIERTIGGIFAVLIFCVLIFTCLSNISDFWQNQVRVFYITNGKPDDYTDYYKFFPSSQSVVYWSSNYSVPRPLKNCCINDRFNWTGEYSDGSAKFEMNNGILTTYLGDYNDKIVSVSRWTWWFAFFKQFMSHKKTRKSSKAEINVLSKEEPRQAVPLPRLQYGSPPAQNRADAITDAELVFVTKSGAKYHRAGCVFLAKSRIPMPLNEAKARYQPCSKCNP